LSPTDGVFSPAVIAGGLIVLCANLAQASPRVLSLDQCADQYVLALSPRETIVGLSRRATNPDSYLRAQARGLPQRRATLESALASRPDVVVRYWGGDERLLRDLRAHGATVVTIADARDFGGVRDDIRRVAARLGEAPAGERLIRAMDDKLAESAEAGHGAGALYVTSGGDTAGPGTLVDAMIHAAGYANLATRPGYSAIPLESLVLHPPSAVALGFFDQSLDTGFRWSPGRTPAMRRIIEHRAVVSLPGAILGCPAWFVADGVVALARAQHGSDAR
jgi:iron complex transport system substrate-binding protein